MKHLTVILLFLAALTACETQDAGIDPLQEKITLKTDKLSYPASDNIILSLNNNSGKEVILGFRCSYKNLEMFYQQKEKDEWSENRWFGYMNLKCMTIQYKMKNQEVLKDTVSTKEFKTTGIFRLLVPCYIPEKDTNIMVISNEFEIKQN